MNNVVSFPGRKDTPNHKIRAGIIKIQYDFMPSNLMDMCTKLHVSLLDMEIYLCQY